MKKRANPSGIGMNAHAISCIAQEPLSCRLVALTPARYISVRMEMCTLFSSLLATFLPSFVPTSTSFGVLAIYLCCSYLFETVTIIAIWKKEFFSPCFFPLLAFSICLVLSTSLGVYTRVSYPLRSETKAKTKLFYEQVFLLEEEEKKTKVEQAQVITRKRQFFFSSSLFISR